MKEEITKCDICGKQTIPNKTTGIIEVIFETEQIEGRSSEPYFDNVIIDLCPECYKIRLTGKHIFAKGCMGTNTFYFK